MSLIFVDSFDTYTQPSTKYDIVQTETLMQTTSVGARNGQCMQLSGSGDEEWFGKNLGARSSYITGFAFYVPTSPLLSNTVTPIVAFVDGSSTQLFLGINLTGNFQFYRGGGTTTAIGSLTSYALSFGVWHYLEVKAVIDGSAGIAELKVDGSFVIQLSGQNTRVSSNNFASSVIYGQYNNGGPAGNVASFRYDDLYIIDPNIGTANTNYLGDVRVAGLLPSGNGTVNDFSQTGTSFVASAVMAVGQQLIDSNGNLQRVTALAAFSDNKNGSSAPTWATTVGSTTVSNHVTYTVVQVAPLTNFNFVNEPAPDDDNSYVSDGTLNDVERYTFPATTGAVVKAVAINARMKKDSSGARSIRTVAHSGGTDGDNGADLPLAAGAYADYQGILEVDPNTGLPWTVSAVNSAEFGVKITV